MPHFDAAGIVEPLECKLRPYADFEDVIREPSDKQVGVFLHGLKQVMADSRKFARGEDAPEDADGEETGTRVDPDELLQALEALEPGKFTEITDRMAGLHADLCSGHPSKTQILAVPLRRRVHFYNWLQNEVLNPEAAPGGGNAQVTRLPSRAAG